MKFEEAITRAGKDLKIDGEDRRVRMHKVYDMTDLDEGGLSDSDEVVDDEVEE